jgi:NAD(P)-dependent dehydrogenase (short-subunit alcohol dehydrogenase family)
VARRLAADGFELLLVDRTLENVHARADELRAAGFTAHPFTADLAIEESVEGLFRQIRSAHGEALSAFVHLAGGFGLTGHVSDTRAADWNHQLTINLQTAFLTSRAAIPMLRGARGAMVFFGSESVIAGAKLSSIAAYAAAKSGVIALALAIAQEETKSGIRVNVLAPAAIRTTQNLAEMSATARFVEREDVAETVSWLCSESAAAVTGQVIRLSPRS